MWTCPEVQAWSKHMATYAISDLPLGLACPALLVRTPLLIQKYVFSGLPLREMDSHEKTPLPGGLPWSPLTYREALHVGLPYCEI